MSNPKPSRFRRLMKLGWVKKGEFLKSYGWHQRHVLRRYAKRKAKQILEREDRDTQ